MKNDALSPLKKALLFGDWLTNVSDYSCPSKNRCKNCAYLFEDSQGRWICDDCGKDISSISDDECSAEQEW